MTPRRPRLLAAALAVPLLLAACSGAAATPAPSTAGACPTSQPPALGAGETRTVTLTTSKGDITIKIKADLSPIAAGNFVALAACGWYTNVVFHRVVPTFVIQGGDGQYGRYPNVGPAAGRTGRPAVHDQGRAGEDAVPPGDRGDGQE